MSAGHLSQANIGNTDVLLSIPKYRPTHNPISQVFISKLDIGNIIYKLQLPIPKGHINIGPALLWMYFNNARQFK